MNETKRVKEFLKLLVLLNLKLFFKNLPMMGFRVCRVTGGSVRITGTLYFFVGGFLRHDIGTLL